MFFFTSYGVGHDFQSAGSPELVGSYHLKPPPKTKTKSFSDQLVLFVSCRRVVTQNREGTDQQSPIRMTIYKQH